MKTSSERPYISNGFMFIVVASILALIGASVSAFIMWVGIIANITLTVCWALIPEFNLFMDSKIKIFKYIYYDSKNDPLSYALWSLCLFAVIVWGAGEYFVDKSLEYDSIYGFTSLYFIFFVMVFVGYYKDYERLP